MSTVPPRSSTGCLTCKCRRKKCDETKPSCLRCRKSGLECPGYVYIQWKNKRAKKLRTLPAPREKKPIAQAQDTDREALNSLPTEWLGSTDADSGTASLELSNLILVPDQMELLQDVDSWPNLVHDDTLTGSYFMSNDTVDPSWAPSVSSTMLPSPPAGDSTPMTHGQASLLNALFSLGDGSDTVIPSTSFTTEEDVTSLSNRPAWPSPDTEEDDSSNEEEDPEGVIRIICQPLALNKNAETNTLPFVLQNYAAWVTRMAYEPLKRAQLARDFVFKQFEDGQDSRWTLTLMANIVGLLGRRMPIDETHFTMISTLQAQIRRRLVRVKAIEDEEVIRSQSIKALEVTLETMVIHVFASPLSKWLTLWKEAAPLFRRLCPEPPGSPINLLSLSQHPDICLRHYAHIDVLCSSLMDSPMLFRYDCTPQNIQSTREATGESQFQTGAQWLHGMPDRFLAVFAKINAMREDGWVATPEIIAVFEHGIQEFQPSQTNCRDSFLSVTRLVVQECWRQAAYVYLYMGLCGDSSDTPRVKQVVKQFMKLLDGTKPGRMPDEFLVLSFILVSPATQKKRDRETIRKRIQGLWVNGYGHGADNMNMIESIWAHADAEGRPVVWSDISKARMRVIGM